jgi:putative nucleotidyltransferase with HDIG domain
MKEKKNTRSKEKKAEWSSDLSPKELHLLEKSQVSLESLIGLMERIVEMNDLYTADHQRRVAKLAVAIAREMGLTAEQTASVYVAAAIHDIGNVYTPDSILNKPERLDQEELRVARNHAEASYYMLEKIPWPWPVSRIARQHHERMDGSGYPDGLSGEDILLEARVLAVADVVEAMTSPRPQRSPLGTDEALKEISAKRGTLYDSKVVDACIRLFTERAFTWS